MTNKEWLRTMSNQELIEWIHINVNFCYNCPERKECFSHRMDCKTNIRNWLNQECEEQ